MENWGLVTYRENALLYHPNDSTLTNKFRVASVVAHELAHQWFGNLVTMNFWGDLWLNEGFATWLEYRGTAAIATDWNYGDEIITDVALALDFDATNQSQSLSRPVASPDDISYQSRVIYNKGASILNMIEGHVGENGMKQGLQDYLNAHAYDTATTKDLFRALDPYSDDDLVAVYSTWADQPGFPVIRVTREPDQIKIQQERYLLDSTWNEK